MPGVDIMAETLNAVYPVLIVYVTVRTLIALLLIKNCTTSH